MYLATKEISFLDMIYCYVFKSTYSIYSLFWACGALEKLGDRRANKIFPKLHKNKKVICNSWHKALMQVLLLVIFKILFRYIVNNFLTQTIIAERSQNLNISIYVLQPLETRVILTPPPQKKRLRKSQNTKYSEYSLLICKSFSIINVHFYFYFLILSLFFTNHSFSYWIHLLQQLYFFFNSFSFFYIRSTDFYNTYN